MKHVEKTVDEYMKEMTDHKELIDKQMMTAKKATAHIAYRQFVRYITSNPRKKAPRTLKEVIY